MFKNSGSESESATLSQLVHALKVHTMYNLLKNLQWTSVWNGRVSEALNVVEDEPGVRDDNQDDDHDNEPDDACFADVGGIWRLQGGGWGLQVAL